MKKLIIGLLIGLALGNFAESFADRKRFFNDYNDRSGQLDRLERQQQEETYGTEQKRKTWEPC